VNLADHPDLLQSLTRWTAVFPFATMNILRGVPKVTAETGLLANHEARAVAEAPHPALAVSVKMSECLKEARRRGAISDIVYTSLDSNIQVLVDYLGGCERIQKTPLPFAYVVHLRRSLVVYCFTLPFALVDSFGWTTILDVMLVSYTFFGIEEIGVEIEGPFGFDDNDLPLEDFCETIKCNVYALAGMEKGTLETLP
jgi:putative membrane protein